MSEEKPKGYLAKFGERLIENGYSIIPIQRGSKRPPGDDWQKIRSTPKLLRSWVGEGGSYTRAGCGILTRNCPAVDLDILDEKLSLQMEAFVLENYGAAPVRIGMAPKRLILFQTDTPFPKVNSRTFRDDWADPEAAKSGSGKPVGDLRKIEILGDGQQFVAYAIHPDTQQPYRWVANGSPSKVRREDLPMLDAEGAAAIVAEFERLCAERGWDQVTVGRPTSRLATTTARGRIATDDVFASDKAKVDISADELRKKLLLVPNNDDHDTWFQVGMALWHQFDGEQAGLDLWHEWSESAANYVGEVLDKRWETFDAEGKNREPLTARFIIKLAQEQVALVAVETFREIREALADADDLTKLREVAERCKHIEFDVLQRSQIVGLVQKRYKEIAKATLTVGIARDLVRYENPSSVEVPGWLNGFVYVQLDKSFYSHTRRVGMSSEAFNASYGRFMLTKKDVLEGKSTPEHVPSQFALNTKQIPVVYNKMYLPGEDDLFTYNSRAFVNTYSDKNIPEIPDRLHRAELEAIEIVKAHMDHLVAVERDREILLDAFAFIVQNPGKRLNWAIMLQGTEGDGKSFWAGLLAAALGPDNLTNLHAQAMEEKYNGWSENAQVVFFEEIKLHGHNRFDVLNKVKPLITNVMVSVRRMNTDIYSVVNTVTYILTTNFRDALPLDDNDTRYFIVFSRWQTKEALAAFVAKNPDYYARLYGTLQYGGALRKWLMARKISPTFSADGRAPDSRGKTEMIRNAISEEAEALDEILKTSPRLDLCSYLINVTELAQEMNGRGVEVPYGKAMGKLLLAFGFTRLKRVRIAGETPMFWSRHPERFTDDWGQPDEKLIKAWLKSEL